MRGGKKERPRALLQKIDQIARAADVATDRSNRFAERTDLDVHASMAIVMVNRAASAAAEHARGVRVVHHHDAAIFLREVAKRREIGNVSIHGENSVADE